jgi:hypothetical protein
MAASTCAAPIKGTHLRIVAVDVCGVPVTGDSGLVITSDGFIRAVMSPQYEDGTEFFQRNAAGDACINQKDKPIFKREELTVDWCEVNALLAAYVIDAQVLGDGTPVTGTGFAFGEGGDDNRFSLEIWQEVAGSGACDSSGNQRFIYNAWPNVGNTQHGDYTVENDKSTFQTVSETQAHGVNWLEDVGAPWLGDTAVLSPQRHWIWNVTTTPPPDAACDSTTLTP